MNRRLALKLACPFCGDYRSRVVDSRPDKRGEAIARWRLCIGCQRRYPTRETPIPAEELPPPPNM